MRINREHINLLFIQYYDSLSITHQMLERAPEIRLYHSSLLFTPDEEYESLLLEILHAHFHWRISGYSAMRAAVVSTTLRATQIAVDLTQRGAAAARSAAQHATLIAARAAYRGALQALEVSQKRAYDAHVALHGYLTTAGLPRLLPPPSSRPMPPTHRDDFENRDGFIFVPPTLSAAVPASASAPSAAPPPPPTLAASMVPASPLDLPDRLPTPLDDEQTVMIDEFPDEIEALTAAQKVHMQYTDRRIVLFNEIVRHIFLNDPDLFHRRFMSASFVKNITTYILLREGRREFAYEQLFLPPEMRIFLERHFAHRTTAEPTFPQVADKPPSPTGSTKDTVTLAGYVNRK